jgi:DNA-binding MarR family transcriptional regulator
VSGSPLVQAEPETETAARLRLAIARVSRRMRMAGEGTGLTPTQTTVLFSVVRNGPLGIAELGRLEGLNPTMLSRVVGCLVDRGLVERRADEADRRAAVVEATDAGRELRLKAHADRIAVLDAQLGQLTPDHRRALEAALPALEALDEQLGGLAR